VKENGFPDMSSSLVLDELLDLLPASILSPDPLPLLLAFSSLGLLTEELDFASGACWKVLGNSDMFLTTVVLGATFVSFQSLAGT